jgi:cbb3-type cytochrome oxidase subunit 3
MLSQEERSFMEYWEHHRDREKKLFYQLIIGVPVGLLFAIPILLNYMAGWYTRAIMVGNSQFNPLILIIAIVIIAVFYAIFNKRHRWEMNEQRYLELKYKQNKESGES